MKERIDRHKDGSIKAKGHMMDGELEGYWEWFRLDGSKLRSGHFKRGKQVGYLVSSLGCVNTGFREDITFSTGR